MSTPIKIGSSVKEIDLLNLFKAPEAQITQRYGRVGQGKTYGATRDVIDELRKGRVVYTNWIINWDGFDERTSFIHLVGLFLFPWKKRLYNFPKDNLRFIEIDEHFIEKFEKLTDCSVYLDEGHVAFDSYEMAKMSLSKRKAVLHTRHFNRSINIISQRPTAIHVTMRANVNIFYKYEKFGKYPFILFRRTEFQDLQDETVNEEEPISIKLYFLSKKIMNSYNSKYMRGNVPDSQKVMFEAYDLSLIDKFKALYACIRAGFIPRG